MDLVAYLESKDMRLKRGGNGNVYTHCVFCDEPIDKRGRLYIQVDPDADTYGAWFCHLCNRKGGINALREHFGDEPIGVHTAVSKSILFTAVRYYQDRLYENITAYQYLADIRGLTDDTIKGSFLGWADGGLLTHLIASGFELEDIKNTGLINQFGSDFLQEKIIIPYFDYGEVVSLRGKEIGGKYLSLPGSRARIYGIDRVRGEQTVLLSAGEFDSLVLTQLGYAAAGVPGENIWKQEWTPEFEDAKRIFILFDNDAAGKAGAEKLATRLGPSSRVVEMPEARAGQKKIDVSEWYVNHGKVREDFDFLLSKAQGGLLVSASQAFDRWTEIEGNPNLVGLRFNVGAIDREMQHGLLPGQVVVVIAKSNSGKRMPVDLKIPTPDGFRRFGDLGVGDKVFGSNGKPTKVTGIFPHGVSPAYRLTFSDGTSTLADAEHLWTVYKRYGRRRDWHPYTLTTQEIMDEGLHCGYKDKEYRFRLPMIQAVDYPEQNLPIGPYTLGALIANGGLTDSIALVTPDPQVVSRVKAEGTNIRPHQKNKQRCDRYGVCGVKSIICDLGLNVKSALKFIPEQYLLGSVEQRFALLQGLMDGDGSNPSRNPDTTNQKSLCYHTTSPQLARDVQEVVSSLGGTGTINSLTRQRDDGAEYEDIRISIMLPDEFLERLFTDRKDIKFNSRNRVEPRRAIVSIEYEGDFEQQCISVDAPDHLYAIERNYILTHNTLATLNIFHRMALIRPDIKILYISLEQTRNEWFERAHRIHNFYEPGSSTLDTIKFWNNKLMMVDKNRLSEAELEVCIDQYEYECGRLPDVVAVDYLGYYSRSFPGEEYARVTSAIMGLKGIAKARQLVFFVPHQVNRSGDYGEELSADQGKSSGAVEETADMLLSLWNPDQQLGVARVDQKKEIKMKILKSRDGGVGQLVQYQFAPLTLAIVPKDDNLYERALRERQYWLAGDDWKRAVYRYKTGDESLEFNG